MKPWKLKDKYWYWAEWKKNLPSVVVLTWKQTQGKHCKIAARLRRQWWLHKHPDGKCIHTGYILQCRGRFPFCRMGSTKVLMVDSLPDTTVLLLQNSPNKAIRLYFENTRVQDELTFLIWLLENTNRQNENHPILLSVAMVDCKFLKLLRKLVWLGSSRLCYYATFMRVTFQ